jgi:3-methylcrotonyl-CoA carboxylase alpha subunit
MPPAVTRIASHLYRVEINGRQELVYVVADGPRRWAWWNGRTFEIADEQTSTRRQAKAAGHQILTAPMPARVLKVNVKPGDTVRKGDGVVILEAMKMEWPIRALADGVVTTVSCVEGALVAPDATLVELRSE